MCQINQAKMVTDSSHVSYVSYISNVSSYTVIYKREYSILCWPPLAKYQWNSQLSDRLFGRIELGLKRIQCWLIMLYHLASTRCLNESPKVSLRKPMGRCRLPASSLKSSDKVNSDILDHAWRLSLLTLLSKTTSRVGKTSSTWRFHMSFTPFI